MKKLLALFLFSLMLLSALPAEAQEVPGFGLSFAPDTQVLDLSGVTSVDPASLSALMDRLPELKEALLYDAALSAEEVDGLRARFPDVFFGLTFRFKDHVVRSDQTAFSTLHNSRDPRHTSEDFAFLRHCVRLEALDLGHNAITDISFLENLTGLKVLIIALNQIEDISPLKNLTQLEYLEMFRNKVRDISPLSGLTNLLDLNMGYNNVQDYAPLYSLKKLERLWLYQSNGYSQGAMKKDKLREIREQLPDCYVDGVSAGTNGGWREHPRYDVIFDIFKTSVYKPFE